MTQFKRIQTNRIIIGGVLLLGFLFSYLGFYVALDLEKHTLRVEHQRITSHVKDAIFKELEISLGILSSIRSLFVASDYVSRSDFSLFTDPTLKAYSSIQALEWIPYLSEAQRKKYEQQAIKDGLVDFKIRERNPQGKMVPAQLRKDYYPVYYVEPLKGNEAAVGFDLASSVKRQITLQQARQSKLPQATASITLVQESGNQKGFLIFQPIFMPENDNLDHSGDTSFSGFALGVFRLGDLLESAITPIKTLLDPLLIELTDITDEKNIDLLLIKSSPLNTKLLSDSSWQIKQEIQFANRTWQLSTQATQAFIEQHANVTHWLVFVTGILLTLIISVFLHILMHRESEIRQLVEQRTHELQSSKKMSQIIVQSAVDAIITIDEVGIVNLFNPSAVNMFGYTPDEVIGRNIKMLMPEPYQSEHDGYLQHHNKTGEKRIIGSGREVKGRHKNGNTFPMNLSVGKSQIDGDTVYVGTITDLTKLKDKEREVREFNDRFNLAIRASGIGVWEFNVTDEIMTWDDRMFQLYGMDQSQNSDTYKAWRNALHPDDLSCVEAEINEALEGGKSFETEFRIIWHNAEEHYIQASALVLFDDEGKVQRMIGVNLDITERKQTEQAMIQAKHVAEEANRQKSAFLNVMSHELRTPLTVILGYLPLLKNPDQTLPSEAIIQIAEDMDLSGQHLMEMVNDILDLSKIEAGQMTLSRENSQSRTEISETLKKFEHQALQKGIQLVNDADDFSFNVDKRRLQQILINLMGNALKFTQQGKITISANRNNDFVTFSVKDTGMGISKSELPYVFDTFRQVDDSSTRDTGGSGLGLAITKRLVELHEGSIQAVSTLGEGTIFTFSIKQSGVE